MVAGWRRDTAPESIEHTHTHAQWRELSGPRALQEAQGASDSVHLAHSARPDGYSGV